MYLIRNIIHTPLTGETIIEDGIRVKKGEFYHHPHALHEFWGRTEIHLGPHSDIEKCPKINEKEFLLSYTSNYFISEIGDGFKELTLNVSSYEPNKLKGILVFIKPGLDMETTGTKLFQRYPDELIVLLKDGQFLKFNDKKVLVSKDQLLLV